MKLIKKLPVLLLILLALAALAVPAFAEPESDGIMTISAAPEEAVASAVEASKPIASAVAIGLAAAGGAIGMGIAIAKSTESVARQPEAGDKIRTTLMLGLVFIETAIIYALLVVILIIFVL